MCSNHIKLFLDFTGVIHNELTLKSPSREKSQPSVLAGNGVYWEIHYGTVESPRKRLACPMGVSRVGLPPRESVTAISSAYFLDL